MDGNTTKIVLTAEDKTGAAFKSAADGMKSLSDSMTRLPVIGSSLAGVLSLAGLATGVQRSIAFAASLDDMAERTGATVESLSALSRVAKIGGMDISLVETGTIRLAKALAGADDEAKGAGHALETLGLKGADLQKIDTGTALKRVADAFAQYEDGAGKTALAMDLFGRSGAQLLPFLKDLAEQGSLVGTVTAEQAAQAEKYEKSLARLTSSVGGLNKALANEMLPTLSNIAANLDKAFSGGVVEGFVSHFKAIFKSIPAALNETMGEIEEKLAKVTFGRVSENHIKQALAYRAQAAKIWGEIANLAAPGERAVNSAPAAPTPKKSLSGYRSKVPALAVAGLGRRDTSVDEFFREAEKSYQLPEEFLRKSRIDIERVEAKRAEIGLLERERQALTAVRKLEDDAADARRNAFRDIKDPQLYAQAIDDINAGLEIQKGKMLEATTAAYDYATSWDAGVKTSLAAVRDEIGNMGALSGKLVTDTFRGMEDGLVDFVKTGKLSFKSLADSIISDLIRIQVRQQITGPLMGTPDKPGLLSSGLSTLSSWLGGLFGGARASGGPVGGGQFYVVGEQGPELLYAGGAGNIIPNHALGGAGAASVQVVVNNNAGGTQATANTRLDAGGKTIIEILVEQVEGRIAGNVGRGTGLAPVMESTYGLNRAAGAWR